MSAVQDHADAFLGLLQADAQLTVYDGAVPPDPAEQYAVVYFYIETPGGLVAPDRVPLTLSSVAVDARAYVHSVGSNATAARAVSGRVRTAVLDVTPSVVGRTCFPVRWLEGQPPRRDEETGPVVMDQVDVYGFSTVPA